MIFRNTVTNDFVASSYQRASDVLVCPLREGSNKCLEGRSDCGAHHLAIAARAKPTNRDTRSPYEGLI